MCWQNGQCGVFGFGGDSEKDILWTGTTLIVHIHPPQTSWVIYGWEISVDLDISIYTCGSPQKVTLSTSPSLNSATLAVRS